jgi:uncharacterized protein with NRDE domain
MCTAFFILGGGCAGCSSGNAADDAARDVTSRGGGGNGGVTASTSSAPATPCASPSLLILFNRDEFFDRETAPAGFWADHPALLAGRDLRRGGTWLGVTRAGRWALLTNFREPDPRSAGPAAPSRGALPTDFLTGSAGPLEYLQSVAEGLHAHNGFNLVVGDARSGAAAYLTNRGPAGAPGHGAPVPLGPGVYGLSNGPLGRARHPHDHDGDGDGDGHTHQAALQKKTGWAKVDDGVAALRSLLASGALDAPFPATLPWASLFGSGLMGRTARDPPGRLPPTGLPQSVETVLSSLFIPATTGVLSDVPYGTRCQTGVAVGADGRSAVLVERSGCVDEGACAAEAAADDDEDDGDGACVPVRWTQVVHEFTVEAGEGGAVVVDEAGACASPESEGRPLVAG